MSKNKIISLIIIIAIVFCGFGFWLANFMSSNELIQFGGYEKGWNAAKQRLSETGYYVMDDEDIDSVFGEVKKISNSEIVLKIEPLAPLADPELDNRIIKISEDTKIYLQKEKDSAQFDQEMNNYNDQIDNDLPLANDSDKQLKENEEIEFIDPPEPFVEEEISLNKIKEGQFITAIADENIKESKTINAIKIIIQANEEIK